MYRARARKRALGNINCSGGHTKGTAAFFVILEGEWERFMGGDFVLFLFFFFNGLFSMIMPELILSEMGNIMRGDR